MNQEAMQLICNTYIMAELVACQITQYPDYFQITQYPAHLGKMAI